MLAEIQAHALIASLYHSVQHVSDDAVAPVLNAVRDLYQWSQQHQSRETVPVKLRVRNGSGRISKPVSIRLKLRVRKPHEIVQDEKTPRFSSNTTTQSPNEKAVEKSTPNEPRLSDASTQSPTPLPPNPTLSRNVATRATDNTALTAMESRGTVDLTCALGSPTPKHKPLPTDVQKASRPRSDLGSLPNATWCVEKDDIMATRENGQSRPSTQRIKITSSIAGSPGPPKKRKRSRSVSVSDDDVIRSERPSPAAALKREKREEKYLSPKPQERTPKRPRQQPIAETFSSQEKLSSVRSRLHSQNIRPDSFKGNDVILETNDDAMAKVETDDAARSKKASKGDVTKLEEVGRDHQRPKKESKQSDKKGSSVPAGDYRSGVRSIPLTKSDVSTAKGTKSATKGDQNCFVKESLSDSHPNSIVDDTQPPPLVAREPESFECSDGSRSVQPQTQTETIESPDFIEETPQQEDPKTLSPEREVIDRSEKVMRQPLFETASQPGHEQNDGRSRKDLANVNGTGEREAANRAPSADVLVSTAQPVQLKSAPSDTPETGIYLKEVSSLTKPVSPSEVSEGLKQSAEKEAFDSNPTIEEEGKVLKNGLPGRISPVSIDDVDCISNGGICTAEDVPKRENAGLHEYGEMKVCISGDQKSTNYSLALTLITMLGGEPVEDFPEERASCVLRLKDAKAKEGGPETVVTSGMEHALASGIPIVDTQWIIQSFANGMWMELEGYETEGSKKTREQWPLFKGIVVSFEEPIGKRTFRKQVRQCFDNAANLVTKGGAVLSSISELSETIEEVGKDNLRLHVHILNDMDRLSDMAKRINDRTKELEESQNIIPNAVVGSKWVSQCLINGQCVTTTQ